MTAPRADKREECGCHRGCTWCAHRCERPCTWPDCLTAAEHARLLAELEHENLREEAPR